MNLIEYYREKALSIEGERQINIIRGCIVASDLDNQDKREMLDFITALEEYLESDKEEMSGNYEKLDLELKAKMLVEFRNITKELEKIRKVLDKKVFM